jgi:hypothetical protein
MLPRAAPTADQWFEWGLGAGLATLGTFGVISLKNAKPEDQALIKGFLTFLRVILATARAVAYSIPFARAGNTKVLSDLAFARNLFLELPPLLNWLKLFGATPANIALTVIDVVTGVVVCALDITLVFLRPPALSESRLQRA